MDEQRGESEGLRVEWIPIDRVFANPANPRINDAGVDPVAASLRRFGWRQPVVAKRTGEVIAGNTRLKAAAKLGMTEVPVVWFDGPDIEATAYAIADNRTHEFSEWDDPALARLLEELRAEDSLDGVGYSDQDIDDLLAELTQDDDEEGDVDDPGPEAPPVTPVSRPGDLWILGDHRILCGDSTNAEDVARLMGGDSAALLATDPPYCVDYTGADRPQDSGKDWSDRYKRGRDRGPGRVPARPSSERAVLHVRCARTQGSTSGTRTCSIPFIDAVFEEFGHAASPADHLGQAVLDLHLRLLPLGARALPLRVEARVTSRRTTWRTG